MQTRVVTTTEEFYALKEQWETLQEQDNDVTYFSTFEYNWTWWDVYKNDKNKELFIVVVENGGRVIGIAPLIIESLNKKLFSYRCIEFIGKGDYLGILLDKSTKFKYSAIINEIFKFIESNNNCFERIRLTHIRADSRLSAYMLRSKKYNKSFNYLMECPVVKYSKFISFDSYKREFVSSNAQQYSNRLKRKVGYSFKAICNKTEDLYQKISKLHIDEQCFLVKNKGRKERSSLYQNKLFCEFLKKLYCKNSRVVTFIIEDTNGSLLAYETCYIYKTVLYLWNTAYNPIYEDYNLGKIINLEVTKYLFENKIADILDFGAGRYFWKFEWTDDFMLVYQLDLWNEKKLKGRLLKKIYRIWEKIKFVGRKNG